MAFAFNSIDSQLDGSQQKANIFDPTQGSVAAQPAAGGGNSSVFQTSAGSTPVGAGATSAASSAPSTDAARKPAVAAPTPGQAQKAYNGVNASDTTKQVAGIQGDISSANNRLQSEADTYAKKQADTAKSFQVDQGTLDKAVSGDQSAFQTAAQRLSTTQAPAFDAFAGVGEANIPSSADKLKDAKNFGAIFKNQTTLPYTQGDQNLESMLLGRGNGFRQTAGDLIKGQSDFAKANDSAIVDKTAAARTQLQKDYDTATATAKGSLGEMGSKITTDAHAAALADQVRRGALDITQLSKTEYEKIKPTLAADLTAAGLSIAIPYLDDPSKAAEVQKYLTLNTKLGNDNDYVDQTGVNKFNAIHGLLGDNQLMTKGGGVGADYSIDANGAQKALLDQTSAEGKGTINNLNQEISTLKAEAANQANKGPDGMEQARQYLTQKYLNQNEGQSDLEKQAEQQAFQAMFGQSTNWEPYYQTQGYVTPQKYTWENALNQGSADRMNEIYKQLGSSEKAVAGTKAPEYNAGKFDANFKQNFDRILAQLQAQQAQTKAKQQSTSVFGKTISIH